MITQPRQGSLDLPFGGIRYQTGDNLAQRQAILRVIQKRQNRLLPPDQIVPASSERHVAGTPEAHCHAVAMFLDLGSGQTGGRRQISHPERTAAPLLNDAASIERPGDEWIPGPRLVRPEQIIRSQPEVQRARRRHLQAVVVHCEPNGATARRVVAMTQRVRERFPCSQGWIKRFVDALETTRLEPARDGHAITQKALRVCQEREGVTVELAVVQELRSVESAEASHAEQGTAASRFPAARRSRRAPRSRAWSGRGRGSGPRRPWLLKGRPGCRIPEGRGPRTPRPSHLPKDGQ